jgi:hypothetical protein
MTPDDGCSSRTGADGRQQPDQECVAIHVSARELTLDRTQLFPAAIGPTTTTGGHAHTGRASWDDRRNRL